MVEDARATRAFERALGKGRWRRFISRLGKAPNDLLPFEEVRSRLQLRGQHYVGLREVPLDHIVGSVGRFRDFDRAFFPRQSTTRQRWISVGQARYEDIELPPVDLYKMGEVYFVRDGNHRVSVARERGQEFIDAHVTEIEVPVPVTPESDLEALELEQERLRFLERTGLERLRPEADFHTAIPGQYEKLDEHISAHRWFLGRESDDPVSEEVAVCSWYDNVYLPMAERLRRFKVTEAFEGLSEADLYLWVMDYQWFLREAYESDSDSPSRAARQRLIEAHPGRPLARLSRMLAQSDWIDDQVMEQERALFVRETGLDRLRPEEGFRASWPGAYERLREHITVHGWFMGESRDTELETDEVVASWYDNVYAPMVAEIREQGLLDRFEGQTATDLYIWILERQWLLREATGAEVPVKKAAEDVRRRRRHPKLTRLLEDLKRDSEE